MESLYPEMHVTKELGLHAIVMVNKEAMHILMIYEVFTITV